MTHNFIPGGASVHEGVQLQEPGISESVTDTVTIVKDTDDDPFAVRAGRFVHGSGAFFALKILSAKSDKQLEEFTKEVVSLQKLRGHSSIVQIRDYTTIPKSRHVIILMELAACDLRTLFKRVDYFLPGSAMFSIWHSLVRAVDAAHKQDIIHMDLKPENFLLVPISPPFADTILATTSVPREKFEFRIIHKYGRAECADNVKDDTPDVELILRDQHTGVVQVLQLVVKVSDFGLAEPLELDASHLSVQGQAGTIKYMAPETFRPSEDGVQRLCKLVDVWALGIMLFQMIHGGRTPYDRYCTGKNNVQAAVAIQSEVIHKAVMKFDRRKVWDVERKILQRDLRTLKTNFKNMNGDALSKICRSVTAMSLLSTEFLFRICERCLAFEASDRIAAADLKRWVETLLNKEWWQQTMAKLSDIEVQALLSGVSVEDGDTEAASGSEVRSQLNESNLAQNGGASIERVFFPELRRVSGNIVALPAGKSFMEECEEYDDGTPLADALLPARGGPVEELQENDDKAQQVKVVPVTRREVEEECEKSDNGAQAHLKSVASPARRQEGVEKSQQNDDGAYLQAVVLPTRGEPVEERKESDSGTHLQAVALPARREHPECIAFEAAHHSCTSNSNISVLPDWEGRDVEVGKAAGPDEREVEGDALSSRRISCGVKGLLICIGLSLLVVIVGACLSGSEFSSPTNEKNPPPGIIETPSVTPGSSIVRQPRSSPARSPPPDPVSEGTPGPAAGTNPIETTSVLTPGPSFVQQPTSSSARSSLPAPVSGETPTPAAGPNPRPENSQSPSFLQISPPTPTIQELKKTLFDGKESEKARVEAVQALLELEAPAQDSAGSKKGIVVDLGDSWISQERPEVHKEVVPTLLRFLESESESETVRVVVVQGLLELAGWGGVFLTSDVISDVVTKSVPNVGVTKSVRGITSDVISRAKVTFEKVLLQGKSDKVCVEVVKALAQLAEIRENGDAEVFQRFKDLLVDGSVSKKVRVEIVEALVYFDKKHNQNATGGPNEPHHESHPWFVPFFGEFLSEENAMVEAVRVEVVQALLELAERESFWDVRHLVTRSFQYVLLDYNSNGASNRIRVQVVEAVAQFAKKKGVGALMEKSNHRPLRATLLTSALNAMDQRMIDAMGLVSAALCPPRLYEITELKQRSRVLYGL